MADSTEPLASAESQPHTGISNRQFYIMAMSSSIGAGLFLASYKALALGGPGALLLAFTVIGAAVWSTMCALGELSAAFPVKGSFYDYAVRFVAPAVGFSMGWNYVINFMLTVPFELTVMVLLTRYWNSYASGGLLITLFMTTLIIIAALGPRWYAEAENVFSIIKLTVIAIFIVTACIILGGGAPGADRAATGFKLWQGTGNDDGAFRNGASGWMYVFTVAAVAYGGTEMLGLMAGECRKPAKIMPVGAKIVAARIFLVYLVPLFLLGLVVNITSARTQPQLTFVESVQAWTWQEPEIPADALISPFVLALSDAKIPYLPDIINGIIIVAIFSMANACVFASSRALAAICAKGMGPRLFRFSIEPLKWDNLKKRLRRLRRRVRQDADQELASETGSNGPENQDKAGLIPVNALCIGFSVALLAFVNASQDGRGRVIFDWLLALAGMSNYLTWISICLSHIRMRMAMKKQGLELDDYVRWKATLGIPGSIAAIVIFLLGATCQIVSAVMPPGPSDGTEKGVLIARSVLGVGACILFWVGYMWWKKQWVLLVPLDQIDLGQGHFGETQSSAATQTNGGSIVNGVSPRITSVSAAGTGLQNVSSRPDENEKQEPLTTTTTATSSDAYNVHVTHLNGAI